MTGAFTESVVEEAALAWLETLGWTVRHGPDIAPGELAGERTDYGQVVLEDRLRQALVRLNSRLPAEALEDAFRKIVRVEGYAGFRADEEPRAFWLGKRHLEVLEVVDRWLAREYRYFKVSADDARQYILRHDTVSGDWELAGLVGAEPGPPGNGQAGHR